MVPRPLASHAQTLFSPVPRAWKILELLVPKASPTLFPSSLPTTREVEERERENEVGPSGN